MGKYKTVPLGDIIELKKGKKASSTTPVPTNKSSRYIQITDLRDDQKISYTEDEKGTRVCPNDLIIAWDGANAGTVSYGLEGLIGSTLTRLRPTNSTFYTPYAGQFLQSRFRLLRNNCSGATIPHIQADVLKSLKIPLPSLVEQKRIAAMLDKADELRRKRRDSIAALDSLTQSIFLDLFGDPVTNPKKLTRTPISKFGDVITGNTPSRKQPEFYGNDIEWIKSDNINTPNHVLTPSTEGLSEKGKSVARTVPANSILVTCIAGSKQCIGNAAMADREVAFNQQINAIVPDEKTDPLFLYVQILVGKKLIQNASTQSMKGMVSKSAFSAVKLLSPPESEQRAFGKKVASIFNQRTRLLSAQTETENLFTALQQKAFSENL